MAAFPSHGAQAAGGDISHTRTVAHPPRSPLVTDRAELESEWLALTREQLPAAAGKRGWPVRFDHCFARILLDHACGGVWYDHIPERPAYRHAPDATLREAVRAGRAALAGEADLHAMNRRSLEWRGKGRGQA